MQRRRSAAGGLILEVLARTPVDRRRTGLVGRHLDARDLGVVGPVQVDRAPRRRRPQRPRGRRRAPRRPRAAASAASRAPSWVSRWNLGGREVGRGAGDRARFVLVGRLAAGPDRPDDLAVDLQRDAAGQARGAVQRQRAEAPAGHLLLHLAARADEDRRGARLVDRDPGAGDLRALGAAHRDQLAGRIDDRDHDPVAVFVRVALRRGDHGVRAGVVDGPSCPR